MKTKIIKTIAALMLSLLSLPMMGQDYLKIYFKDGHTERHYMRLVESISTTKFDLEGNLHNDYQMQQIVMPDTTYSYYLTEIDSMAFRKVNVEEVKNLGESVQASLEPIFQQCSNFQDLESHIDEIKSIDGIEETYYDDNNLFIQIRDWPVICISRQRIPEDIAPSSISLGMQNIKSLVPTTDDGSSLKAIIGFQMKDDFWFMDAKVKIDLLNTKFSIMGYNPVYDLGEDVDFDFLYRRIFDSNILLIDTHGGCGIFNKKHYLYTGIVSSSNDFVGLNVDKWFNISENIDLDDIGVNSCYYEGDNLFNNPFGQRWYFTVTEDYIRKSPYRFEGEGPHIVFVAACSSLQGNNILTRSDGEQCYGNDSFAQVFFEKGADVYIGYNQGSYRSSFAANSFFDRMLHGASVEKAFDMLHSLYKYESDKDEQAKLVDLYNQNSKNPKGIFIVKTHTETKTDKEINEEFATNRQVKLNGTTFCWDLYEYPQIGFRISTEPNINESTTGIDVLSIDAHLTGEKYKEVAFSGVFNAEPGTTYYYRAYTYDNIYFNWGEERILTTPKKLELSVGSIFLNEGESTTVEITSGNGDYAISVDKPSIATASVSGTTITIKGVSKGTAKVTVKDKSGQTAEINVNVWDNLTLSQSSVGLYPGNSTTVEITNGSGHYTVSVDKPAIATASLSGSVITIKGVGVGSAVVTVTDTSTNQTAKINVTVSSAPTLVVSNSSVELMVGGSSTVEITSGSGSYEITNSNVNVVQAVLDGAKITLTAKAEGNAVVTVKDKATGQTASISVTVNSNTNLVLSQSNVDLTVGAEATVEIVSGSGEYSVAVDKPSIATVSLSGSIISIKGVCEGAALVSVKDLSSGEATDIKVTVQLMAGKTLWSGSGYMAWGEGLQLSLPASDFAGTEVDDQLVLYYEIDGAARYSMVQFFDGNWSSNPQFVYEGTTDFQFNLRDITGQFSGAQITPFVIPVATVSTLQSKGLIIHGYGATLTKVVLVDVREDGLR